MHVGILLSLDATRRDDDDNEALELDRIRLMSNRIGDKHLLAKLPRTKILTDDKCNCKKNEKKSYTKRAAN